MGIGGRDTFPLNSPVYQEDLTGIVFSPLNSSSSSALCVCVCSYRVASVQSEPGQQNLLIQPPLGRKRGLRQVRSRDTKFAYLKICISQKRNTETLCVLQLRRPLLSIQRVQDESRGRQGARLSTTRRSIQPKNKPIDRGVC